MRPPVSFVDALCATALLLGVVVLIVALARAAGRGLRVGARISLGWVSYRLRAARRRRQANERFRKCFAKRADR